MITDVNSEDRLVQRTFAEHLEMVLGWNSVYAYNAETFGPNGTLGRMSERDAVLVRDLRAALERLNPGLPASAREQAIEKLTRIGFARSLIQHNREFCGFIRAGVPVEWRDAVGVTHRERAQVIDFRNGTGPDGKANNRFLAVRELKIQGVRVPHYNRRGDLVCSVNGLPGVHRAEGRVPEHPRGLRRQLEALGNIQDANVEYLAARDDLLLGAEVREVEVSS